MSHVNVVCYSVITAACVSDIVGDIHHGGLVTTDGSSPQAPYCRSNAVIIGHEDEEMVTL